MNSTRHFLLALGLCVCLPATVRAQADYRGVFRGLGDRVLALYDQKQYADAQKLLEDRLAHNPSEEQRVSLRKALAEVHFTWANTLRENNPPDQEQAIVHYLAAYEIDKPIELNTSGRALAQVGGSYFGMGRFPEAAKYWIMTVPSFYETNDQKREEHTFVNITYAYQMMRRLTEVLPAYEDFLRIRRERKDRKGEALVLRMMGRLHFLRENFDDGIKTYKLALSIYKELKDLRSEALTLNEVGHAYEELGRYEEALNYYNQALSLYRNAKDQEGEATTLGYIGKIYVSLGRYEQALHCQNQDLSIRRAVKDKTEEVESLNNISLTYSKMGRYTEALDFLNQALSLQKEFNISSSLDTIVNIGSVYSTLGRYKEALRFYNQALSEWQRLNIRTSAAECLQKIGDIYQSQNQPQLAILYDKQALNLIQSVRFDNQNLDKVSQRSFLDRKRSLYKILAALLVGQNRLEEAEQVLRFLRQEDAFEFAQRDPQLARELITLFQPLVFTATEKGQLDTATAKTADVGEGCEESRLWQQALVERERAGGGRAALLSTFNTDDTFYLLLTTAKGRRAFSVPIKKSEFDALSGRLQKALSHPDEDPRPDAQKMYNIVFAGGQLEQALQAENVTTALWFASGSLRTIPIDALYDGKQYLVQKPCANVGVTLTSRRLFDATTQGPTLAVGVSQPHTVGTNTKGVAPMSFSALSNVPKEVRSIVSDPADGGTGPFPGKIFLDKQFTAANLEQFLAQARGAAIVHIATHFALNDQGEEESFLLLGDGAPLPVSLWKQALKLQGVGLLTLSACETGVGSSNATGGEVSSIGEVSQYLGAQSVIVSLWPVSDSSTADLMKDFYTRLHNAPEEGKAEALRDAQRALLGTNTAPPLALATRGQPQQQGDTDDGAPPFTKDPKHPYAHPFYWAPFSLIGNWK